MKPTRAFHHGMPTEYQIELPDDQVAIVTLVAAKGWEMTIRDRRSGSEVPRGLFATPHDALLVISAEVQRL